MTYRLAKSLEVLRDQINDRWPKRNKASDGWIGNPEHASRSSDHNPWVKRGGIGIVTAIDVTNDPANGLDSRKLAEMLVASRDPRIKYVISNAQICSSYPSNGKPAWSWRPYTGVNAHRHHCHISVNSEIKFYDSDVPWKFDGMPVEVKLPPKELVKASGLVHSELKKGSKGYEVGYLQRMLGIDDDENFGPKTEKAVRQFQTRSKLPVTGVCDAITWAALIS